MDKNKLAELRRIDYRIPKTCGLCKHGVFVGINEWGGCAIQTYDHLKHSESKRQLSIFKGGSCTLFEEATQAANVLGAYYEFLK
jgi:hypothetical protein